MTAKYDRTRRLGTGQKTRELRLEFCQWRALQTRECEVEHVAIGRAAILIGWAIENREAKQVHSVIAAIDKDRIGLPKTLVPPDIVPMLLIVTLLAFRSTPGPPR